MSVNPINSINRYKLTVFSGLLLFSSFFAYSGLSQQIIFVIPAVIASSVFIYFDLVSEHTDSYSDLFRTYLSFGAMMGALFAIMVIGIMYFIRLGRRGIVLGLFEWAPYLLNSVVILSAAGAVVGVVYGKSVSNRLKYEEISNQLEDKNQRIEIMAGAISHDLRNPLATASGHASLLEDDNMHKEPLMNAHERMEKIVESSLALIRADRNMDRESLNLRDVIKKSWNQTETDGVSLEIQGDTVIEGDQSFIGQAFENAFRNTSEHTDATEVTVKIEESVTKIIDNGGGFPDELLGEIDYTDSKYGIGLAVIGFVAHEHGWTATLKNDGEYAVIEVETDE